MEQTAECNDLLLLLKNYGQILSNYNPLLDKLLEDKWMSLIVLEKR